MIDRKVGDRYRLSASRMKTFMTCPLQARFQYVDQIPQLSNSASVFGNCVHHALERYNHTQDCDGAIAIFTDAWAHPEKYGLKIDTWTARTTFGSYMAKGKEAIKTYHENLRWDKRTVVAAEHKFLVPFGEFDITGAIDCLEIVKSKKGHEELKITDYKTNGRAPFMNALRLNIQFSIYDYASRQPEFWLGNPAEGFPAMENGEWWWEQIQDLPRRNIWYGLMQQKEYDAGERGDADYMRLYRCATEMAKALRHDVFIPSISGDSCGFCPYTEPCKLPINPRDYVPEDA